MHNWVNVTLSKYNNISDNFNFFCKSEKKPFACCEMTVNSLIYVYTTDPFTLGLNNSTKYDDAYRDFPTTQTEAETFCGY